MTHGFITEELENVITLSVIDAMVPRMIDRDKKTLTKYLYGTVQMIASCYNFYDQQDAFYKKLSQNDYKDLRWLLTCILPFIDQSRKSMQELTSLEELYSLRYDDVKKCESLETGCVEDINHVDPKYVFSNLQYGRFVRGDTFSAIHYNESHLQDNYYLLLNTIKTSRNKLYVNWIDIVPYRMDEFKTSKLWLGTKEKIVSRSYEEMDPKRD